MDCVKSIVLQEVLQEAQELEMLSIRWEENIVLFVRFTWNGMVFTVLVVVIV